MSNLLKSNLGNRLLQDIVANKEKFSELKKRNLSVMLIYHFKQLMEKIKVEFVSTMYLMNNKKSIQCIIRDITDRKRIEEALTLLRCAIIIFESAKEGIFY
jgi:two-component system CheB/CheR fusion protein